MVDTGSARCSDSCSPLCWASCRPSGVGLEVCFRAVLRDLLPLPEQPLLRRLVCTYLLLGPFPGRAEPEPRGGNRAGIRASAASPYAQSDNVFPRGAGPARRRPLSAASSPQLPLAHSGLPKPHAKRGSVLPRGSLSASAPCAALLGAQTGPDGKPSRRRTGLSTTARPPRPAIPRGTLPTRGDAGGGGRARREGAPPSPQGLIHAHRRRGAGGRAPGGYLRVTVNHEGGGEGERTRSLPGRGSGRAPPLAGKGEHLRQRTGRCRWVRGAGPAAEEPGGPGEARPPSPWPFVPPSSLWRSGMVRSGRGGARPSPPPLALVPLRELSPPLVAAARARLRSGPLGRFLSALKSVRRGAWAGGRPPGAGAAGWGRLPPGRAVPCRAVLCCNGRAALGWRWGGGGGSFSIFPARARARGGNKAASSALCGGGEGRRRGQGPGPGPAPRRSRRRPAAAASAGGGPVRAR